MFIFSCRFPDPPWWVGLALLLPLPAAQADNPAAGQPAAESSASDAVAAGRAALEAREFGRAIAEFTKALQLDRRCAEAYIGRAQAHIGLDHADAALRDADEALGLDPRLVKAYLARALLLYARSEYDRAIADCTEAIKLDPKLASAYSGRGSAHAAKGEHDRAIADFTEAITLDPEGAAAHHINRGESQYLQNRFDEAIADFTAALQLDPKSARAYNDRANAHDAKGDYDRAVVDYTEALRFAPEDAVILANRASTFQKKGDYDRAIADYSSAIGKNATSADLYKKRSDVYQAKGDYDRAFADLAEPVRLDPKDAAAYKNLTERYDRLLEKLWDKEKKQAEAIALAAKMVSIKRIVFGEVHQEVASALMVLAKLNEGHQDFAAALQAHEERLVLIRKLFGEQHPRVADARYALTHVRRLAMLDPEQRKRLDNVRNLNDKVIELRRQGKPREAIAPAERALAIRRELLGEQDAQYADSLEALATLHRDLGASARAEALFRQALDVYQRATGELHPRCAGSVNALAELYQERGDYAQAAVQFRRAVEIRRMAVGEDDSEYAEILSRLAEVLARLVEQQGRPEDVAAAIAASREVVANRARRLGEEHWQTTDARLALARIERLAGMTPAQRQRLAEADELSKRAEALDKEGKTREALPLAERTLAIQNEVLGERDPACADTLQKLSALYQALKDYVRADTMLGRSVAINKEVRGEEHPTYATSLLALALLDYRKGDDALAENYARAEALCRRAAEIFKKVHGEEDSYYLSCLSNLAAIYTKMGEYAKAEPLYLEVLAIRRRVLDRGRSFSGFYDDHAQRDSFYATILQGLAGLYLEMRDYAQAAPLYRKLLEIEDPQHPNYQFNLSRLAGLLMETGDYARAEPLYRKLLEIKGQDGSYVLLNNLARLHWHMGEYAEAEALYRKALESCEKAGEENSSGSAVLLDNLALCYADMGEYAKAEPLYRKALEIKKKTQGERHPNYAISLNNLALLHQRMGDYPRAEPLYRQALEIDRSTVGERHPEFANSQDNLGRLYWEMGDFARAESLLGHALQAAGEHLELAASAQSERQQLVMARSLRDRLDDYLSLSLQAQRSGESAYGYVLSWKGGILLRQRRMHLYRGNPDMKMTARAVGVVTGDDGQVTILVQPSTSRYDVLERVANRLSSLVFARPDPKQQEERRRLIQELTDEKERLESELAGESAESRRKQAAARPTPAQVRDALPPDAVLIDFLEYSHDRPAPQEKGKWVTTTRLAAFVVRREQPVALIDLGPVKPIADAVEAWRVGVGRDRAGAEDDALRRLVWAPLEDRVKGARLLLVSPDGPLDRFPFAALPSRGPGTYLLEDMAVAVVPVPQMLPELLAPPAAPAETPAPAPAPGLLVVGDVAFDADPGTSTAGTSDRSAARGDLVGETLKWAPLPGTWPEIVTIEESFRRRYRENIPSELRAEAATEDKLRQEAPKHRFLHIATHGFFAPPQLRSALASTKADRTRVGDLFARQDAAGFHPGVLAGLVLAGANTPPDPARDDGILTALEVAELDLSGVELATLSACETGLGESAGGEGLLSLQRAFQVAGTHSVVASLWKVPDRATQALMERFYKNLWQEGMPRLEALREAQLWMLREAHTQGVLRRGLEPLDPQPAADRSGRMPPRYWAAFVLSGDWR
jgi:tetratricopeptide (TPR) repeat protein/CHAT domain-containing protein